jgi:hypothetical protein
MALTQDLGRFVAEGLVRPAAGGSGRCRAHRLRHIYCAGRSCGPLLERWLEFVLNAETRQLGEV